MFLYFTFKPVYNDCHEDSAILLQVIQDSQQWPLHQVTFTDSTDTSTA